jgi:hypothetical protein
MPAKRTVSPIRVVTKALKAAFLADSFSNQKPMQQIAAQPHDLPEDEEGEQRVGDNESEHTGGKEAAYRP